MVLADAADLVRGDALDAQCLGAHDGTPWIWASTIRVSIAVAVGGPSVVPWYGAVADQVGRLGVELLSQQQCAVVTRIAEEPLVGALVKAPFESTLRSRRSVP